MVSLPIRSERQGRVLVQGRVEWLTAAPLWKSISASQSAEYRRPSLLTFTSDAFMDDLLAILNQSDADVLRTQFRGKIAASRTFRPRPAGAPLTWTPPPVAGNEIKLYQPAHGHFNLVAANLVCRQPGLPDRTVALNEDERVTFVLRKVEPFIEGGVQRFREFAWVPANKQGWTQLPANLTGAPATGEEQLPMFRMSYALDEQPRSLWTGVIPTSSTETYRAGRTASPIAADFDPPNASNDPRVDELKSTVITPMTTLRDGHQQGNPVITTRPPAVIEQQLSWFVLLDLVELLRKHIPRVWQKIENASAVVTLTPNEQALLNAFQNNKVDTSVSPEANRLSWVQAINQTVAAITNITENGTGGPVSNLRHSQLSPGTLQPLFTAALPAVYSPTGTNATTQPVPVEVPKFDEQRRDQYWIRCVYERPNCKERFKPLLSEPTSLFQLAPFFDSDAPARPIRIALPFDTSIKGLRKFDRNVAVVMSKQLREQIAKLKLDMPPEAGSDVALDFGTICSLSIPIITICAFILLMIIVSILNIIFWWLPMFIICLPLRITGRMR